MCVSTYICGWTLLAERDGHAWDFERAIAEAKQGGVSGCVTLVEEFKRIITTLFGTFFIHRLWREFSCNFFDVYLFLIYMSLLLFYCAICK